MTVKQQIEKLKTDEIYSHLLKSGVISLKVDFYYQMYKDYILQIEKHGYSRADAIFITSENFKVCEGTVYNAVKFMKR
jgi:hypothetical protein